MYQFVCKNPLATNFIICLLLFLTAGIFISVAHTSFLILGLALSFCSKTALRRFVSAICVLSSFVLMHLFNMPSLTEPILLLLFGAAILFEQHLTHSKLVIFIIWTSFLLHLFYLQQTDIFTRQHDLSGIRLYMAMIIQSGLNLYDFNPWFMYYLFHQPLHFFINGHILEFMQILPISYMEALENLQYISLFYVTGTIILYAKILNLCSFPYRTNCALLALAAFNPTLILFSGYISDDTPVLFWLAAVIYFILRWYKREKTFDIIAAALCFGAGTLTKLSLLLPVPAICCLFAYKLFCSSNRSHIWANICLFVIIAVPLSLFWIIRNHILFDMQFFNVPDTSPAGQNFFHQSLSTRLYDFSGLFTPFLNAPDIVDKNIILAILKTELFGEWDLSLTVPFIYQPALALYLLNIMLQGLVFIAALYGLYQTLRRYNHFDFIPLFFIIQYFTVWLYLCKYALDYPYICSTDFRLFAQLIFAQTLLGFAATKKTAEIILSTVAVIYTLLAVFIYGALIVS